MGNGYRQAPPSSWRRTPLPPDWARRRQRVLRRDEHTCQIRGDRCTTVATEVDHVGDPGNHELDSLQAVCSPCHATKTGRDVQARKPRRRRAPETHPGLIDPGT